jgi:hypothetical protein
MMSRPAKIPITLLIVALGVWWGIRFVQQSLQQEQRLRAFWTPTGLRILSTKDGPWVVTHLVKKRSEQEEFAVAQLPTPVTIIDSRGEFFTTNILYSLTWISPHGDKVAPPREGQPMSAYYYVPLETEATK